MSSLQGVSRGKKRKRRDRSDRPSDGSSTITVAGKRITINTPTTAATSQKAATAEAKQIVTPLPSSIPPPENPSDLPIRPHADHIRTSLGETDVLIVSGETGSGKSTLVPQFLLSAPWRSERRIAVTQPRRVAAINLARRVAEELGTPVGRAPTAKVGYSVRFDDNVGKNNSIKFLTEGMLLQEILRRPGLDEYDVVIVDEVHERSVNVDLILGFLKGLVTDAEARRRKRKGHRLKLVIMSATADVELFRTFFNEPEPTVSADGTRAVGNEPGRDIVSTCFVKGRQHPVETIYLPEPADDFLEAALKAVFQIHCGEPMPGDILVFLTGQETIQSLQKSLEEYAQGLGKDYPKMLVLPLYAALSQTAQQLIFQPPPRGTRKVILSTNIAETSLTVPGVRFVVDSGKEKRRQYRPRLGLDSLLVKAISQSSAIQRKGRAGREGPGKCWRLYTEKDYLGLEERHAPEILRCDLADAVLKMKVNGVGDPSTFPLLTPPSRDSMARALISLHQLGALGDGGEVTPTGRKMSRLPLSPALARTLVAAAAATTATNCLLPVIDIVSALSTDNQIFLAAETESLREEATSARASLHRRQGDHLTLLAAVQAYAAEQTDRRHWCARFMVNHRSMQSVMDIRKQLRAQLAAARLLPDRSVVVEYDAHPAVSEDSAAEILKCFLRGLRANVARLVPDGSYKTFYGNQTVSIHPGSVLYGKKVEAILYNEFVFTNKTFARGVSVVQLDWVGEILGAD